MVDANPINDEVAVPMPTIAELRQLYDTIETSVSATSKAIQALLEKYAICSCSHIIMDCTVLMPSTLFRSKDESHNDFDFANGLSLLLIRPHLLLASIHQLVIMLGLRLASGSSGSQEDEDEDLPSIRPFSADRTERPSLADRSGEYAEASLKTELTVIREVMEKTKGLESKVSYQVKKLVTLANEAGLRETQKPAEGEEDNDVEGESLVGFRGFYRQILMSPKRSAFVQAKPVSPDGCFK